MRTKVVLLAAMPACITLFLAIMIFAPVIQQAPVGPYVSITFLYGGWGAMNPSYSGGYGLDSWICSCPAEFPGHVVPCCVAPYAWLIWPVVWALVAAGLFSFATAAWLVHKRSL